MTTRRPFAFVLPLVALVWVAEAFEDRPLTGVSVLGIAVVCGAAGVAWQLLHRRDLVDRLTHAAAWFTVGVAILALVGRGRVEVGPPAATVALVAVLTGLVHTEQWLRARDRRRAPAPAAARRGTPVA